MTEYFSEEQRKAAEAKPRLPYDSVYIFEMHTGFAGGSREKEFNPSADTFFTQEEWDEMTRDEQESFLCDELDAWRDEYIETTWKPKEEQQWEK